jgi:N-acetylated-alpha-linked acidic dipeptidase
MNVRAALTVSLLPAVLFGVLSSGRLAAQSAQPRVLGFQDFTAEAAIEDKFLAVPDARLAGEELKILTAEPHIASSPEDRKTADYVARKFRAAGLETEIVPYRVLLNMPKQVRVEAYDPSGRLLLSGPAREHVEGDTQQDNPRVVAAFHGFSGSGEVTGEVVYANYCRLEDYNELAARHIDLRGKIALCRYGANFRGVKVYLAELRGAIGVLLYSDPADDGFTKGDPYPLGPWRPETAVERGSVQYLFHYPGDPETPGVASTMDLPDSARIRNFNGPKGDLPRIVSIPISYHDAAPILQALSGQAVPRGWQGGLSFPYHVGPGGVLVHLVSNQDYQRRVIWNVIGKIRGAQEPDSWVIVGNHRDAWVYGAADPSSGTAAMLETVHGIGALLKQGWRPRRTIVFCNWDGEEEGMIGSTEWVEQQGRMLDRAVAYFNMDVGASGPDFSAEAVPSLKEFIRAITRAVPSPMTGTVYQRWRLRSLSGIDNHGSNAPSDDSSDAHVGDLGSGSDFTPFLQHAGVPSTDISSEGTYGVYHSTFDDYAWYTQNVDPHFYYLQQMARVLGLEALRMADADVLPFDYVTYTREIQAYLEAAKRKAAASRLRKVDFTAAEAAAARFAAAAQRVYAIENAPSGDLSKLNLALRQTETALLSPAGLPNRPWFRHTIFAPGEFTGYAAVVLPGVNDALDARNAPLASQQLAVLAQALDRAAGILNAVR